MIQVAAGVITALVPIIYNGVKDKLEQYSETDQKDFLAIAGYFTQHCPGKHSINIDFHIEGGQEATGELQASMRKKLPIYLQYNREKSKPQLYVIANGNFKPCKDPRRWVRQLGSSHLKNPIKEAIRSICEYQRNRSEEYSTLFKNKITKREFDYDPVNLFFEELKVWLLQLSHLSLTDEILLVSIQERIAYLGAIADDHNLFASVQRCVDTGGPTKVRATIVDVLNVLKNVILPTINDALSRRTALEHFDQLSMEIESSVPLLIEMIFHYYRDPTVAPTTPIFLLEQLRQPELPIYKKMLKSSSVLDAILRYLVRSEKVTEVIPPSKEWPNAENELTFDSFLSSTGLVNLPILAGFPSELTRDNFWLYGQKENGRGNKSGIFKLFRNKVHMDQLLRLAGYVQRLCLAHNITKEFRYLAGEGGDLLVYRLAAKTLIPILNELKELFVAVTEDAQKLHEDSQRHHRKNVASHDAADSKMQPDDKAWGDCYLHGKEAYDQLSKALKACQKGLVTITTKLEEVNQKGYMEHLKRRVAHLQELLCEFLPDQAVMDRQPPLALPQASSPRAVMFAPVCDAVTAAVSDEIHKIIAAAHTLISDHQYEDAKEFFEFYFKTYPDDIVLIKEFAVFMMGYGKAKDRLQALDKVGQLIQSEDSSDLELLFLKAKLQEGLGDLTDARVTFQKILEINPEHQRAKGVLLEIQQKRAELDAKVRGIAPNC